MKSSTCPNHSNQQLECDQVVCSAHKCTSSTDPKMGIQPSRKRMENHTNAFQLCAVTQQMLNGGSSCHQQCHREELDTIHSELLLKQSPEREKGQLKDRRGGDHSSELMSELEVFESNHNKLRCFVQSNDPSKSSVACHDFTVLPTRATKQTQRLEAKCRALDSVNQHLQTSLDNTGGF